MGNEVLKGEKRRKMKIRYYNTPNSWWYIGIEYKKNHCFSISFLKKKITLYYGENTKLIP